MKELYYLLSILLVIILGYIAYQDWKNKMIYLWSFYLLNIVCIFWLFSLGLGYTKYIMVVFFVFIILLDILDYFGKKPKFISDDWMIGGTGIYDYWLYLLILVLFIEYLSVNFLYYYIGFSVSLVFGSLLSYLLTKKRYAKHIPLFVYGLFIVVFMMFFIFKLI